MGLLGVQSVMIPGTSTMPMLFAINSALVLLRRLSQMLILALGVVIYLWTMLCVWVVSHHWESVSIVAGDLTTAVTLRMLELGVTVSYYMSIFSKFLKNIHFLSFMTDEL